MLIDVPNIPTALQALNQWVSWRYEQRDGKATKVPYQQNGDQASSTDPNTWATFASALAAQQRYGFDGIGFVVTPEVGGVGVGLDHCRDTETGAIEPWAQDVIDQLNSYTEVTPSDAGHRILAFGHLPPRGRKRGNLEMYESGRYLTVTGHHLNNTPKDIQERQAEIQASMPKSSLIDASPHQGTNHPLVAPHYWKTGNCWIWRGRRPTGRNSSSYGAATGWAPAIRARARQTWPYRRCWPSGPAATPPVWSACSGNLA